MFKLIGDVFGEPLSSFEGLPVFWSHCYHAAQLGTVKDGFIVLFHPHNGIIDDIRNGLVYIVNGGTLEHGKERTMELSLTLHPIEKDKACVAKLIEDL